LATEDPVWAWLLVHLDVTRNVALKTLAPFARKNLERGSTSGRLSLVDQDMALISNGGILLAVMRAVLEGTAPANADVLHAEGVLRMLGLSTEDAKEVANREFPEPS